MSDKGMAVFHVDDAGRVIEWGKSSVFVQRGHVVDETKFTKVWAVVLKHGPSGNVQEFLLTEEGASALAILLTEALAKERP